MMRTLCLVCLLLLSGGVRGDELMASVDRQRIAEGDTVELTLELGGLALSGQPDLSPLLPLFEVLDSRQVNRVIRDDQGSRSATRASRPMYLRPACSQVAPASGRRSPGSWGGVKWPAWMA